MAPPRSYLLLRRVSDVSPTKSAYRRLTQLAMRRASNQESAADGGRPSRAVTRSRANPLLVEGVSRAHWTSVKSEMTLPRVTEET